MGSMLLHYDDVNHVCDENEVYVKSDDELTEKSDNESEEKCVKEVENNPENKRTIRFLGDCLPPIDAMLAYDFFEIYGWISKYGDSEEEVEIFTKWINKEIEEIENDPRYAKINEEREEDLLNYPCYYAEYLKGDILKQYEEYNRKTKQVRKDYFRKAEQSRTEHQNRKNQIIEEYSRKAEQSRTEYQNRKNQIIEEYQKRKEQIEQYIANLRSYMSWLQRIVFDKFVAPRILKKIFIQYQSDIEENDIRYSSSIKEDEIQYQSDIEENDIRYSSSTKEDNIQYQSDIDALNKEWRNAVETR